MIKFDTAQVTFQEIPTEVSLTFAITGCKRNCEGCHSQHLRKDDGIHLDKVLLTNYIKHMKTFISCVTFLGGDNDKEELIGLLKLVKANNLKTALYTGADEMDNEVAKHLDYIKIGHYDKDKGPLSKRTTNQRLINLSTGEDITRLFWKE